MTSITIAPSELGGTSSSPAKPLPVFATLATSFDTIIAHPVVILRLSAAWLVIGAVTMSALLGVMGTAGLFLSVPVMMLWFVLAGASVATGWHRFQLLGEVPNAVYLRLDRHVGRYLVGAILLMLTVALLMLVAAAIAMPTAMGLSTLGETWGTVAGLAVFLPAYALFALLMPRLALILPARAIDKTVSFGQAFEASRGNACRLLAVTVLASMPVAILNIALGLVDTEVLALNIAMAIVSLIAALLTMFVATSLLSATYRHCVQS